MLEGKAINVSPLFQKIGLDTKGLWPIVETPKMYPYKIEGDIRQNWSYFMTFGLSALRQEMLKNQQKLPASIGITGIGNGIEGIAAAKIFENSLRQLFIVDTDNEILNGALVNIRRNINKTRVEVIGHVGSFAEPLEAEGVQVDLFAGNVPNLPSEEDQELITGADHGTFMPRAWYEKYQPPEKFMQWALGTQYAHLKSARNVVKEGGSALTLVGGRFPLHLADDLFKETGYQDLQEVISGLKEQTEPEPDFLGYSRFEEAFEDVAFDFYPYAAAERVLQESNIANPTRVHNAARIKTVLRNLRKSAGDALSLYHQGIACGHTVHLFRGTR